MTNNFEIIKPLLDFSDEDSYYFLQVYMRKKDHANRKVNGTNNNNRLIRPYYVGSLDYLEFIMPEVIELCELFKARAGIDLNKRSWERSAFHTLKKVADQVMNKDYKSVHRAYSKVAGMYSHEKNKKWLLDIDNKILSEEEIITLGNSLESLDPVGPKILARIPSNSGEHIITSPFNLQQGRTIIEDYKIDVHKKNPVNIYIPKIDG